MLIGIDRDEPLEKVIAFGKSTGVTYPWVWTRERIYLRSMRSARQVSHAMS